MRFGRKQAQESQAKAAEETGATGVEHSEAAAPRGPYDVSEIDPADGTRIDLGSLLIAPFEGAELRLQVDESSGQVLSVLLVGDRAGMEARAFAAPRSPGLWETARAEITTGAQEAGAAVEEREGPFGPELYVEQPVTTESGEAAVQPSRVIGMEGPRWFLRITLLGQPAAEPETAGPWEEAIRAIAVRRGADPMPPGEALPLEMPDNAQRVD